MAKPTEMLVADEQEPCPYLPAETARLPLRLPMQPVLPEELDRRLALGQRRSGYLFYDTQCPTCRACETIRLDVNHFRPNRSQRRIWRRGQERIEVGLARPTVDDRRVEIYNRHKQARNLSANHGPIEQEDYRGFLVSSSCDSIEISYRVAGQLIAVAIADRGAVAMSAVYCYYDPDFAELSPGVFSVLQQVELCRAWGMRYLYLGYFIAACPAMAYKARYLPHERLLAGQWREFGG